MWPFKKKKIDYKSILNNFSYKEGSSFYVGKMNDEKHDSIILKSAPVVCADTGEEDRHTYSWRKLSEFNLHDEEKFKLQVLALCFQQEIHEAMEFLRYDGDKIFDPHIGKYSKYSYELTFKG